ncbi:MAG: NAD-binding protein [Nitrososphaerales archaeon]
MALKVALVGGGRVGSRLANMLQKEGHRVIVIERNREVAEKLANENAELMVINSDVFDKTANKEVFEGHVDVFIAATSDDQTNMLACEIAKRRGIPRTIARVVDPDLSDVFLELDITPVNETLVTVESIRRLISSTEREHIITQICNDKAIIFRKVIKEDQEVVGKNLKEAKLLKYLICIDRDGEVIYPEDKVIIKVGDIVYVVSTYEDLDYIKEILK